MGVFSKPKPAAMCKCKLCRAEVAPSMFTAELEICMACTVVLNSHVQNFLIPHIDSIQKLANEANDPDAKIVYLRTLLDALYTYKVKYYDNDVDVLTTSVEDLIDHVIDCISYAREE